VPQAKALGELTEAVERPVDVVIDLDVPRELVLDRLSRRRVCNVCGQNYVATGLERPPWICDNCGGDVVQRDDDTPEAINIRLDLYESQTAPLVDYFDAIDMLSVINGVGHPDDVFRRILDTVERRRRRAAGA
jgi:adenylate kinase